MKPLICFLICHFLVTSSCREHPTELYNINPKTASKIELQQLMDYMLHDELIKDMAIITHDHTKLINEVNSHYPNALKIVPNSEDMEKVNKSVQRQKEIMDAVLKKYPNWQNIEAAMDKYGISDDSPEFNQLLREGKSIVN